MPPDVLVVSMGSFRRFPEKVPLRIGEKTYYILESIQPLLPKKVRILIGEVVAAGQISNVDSTPTGAMQKISRINKVFGRF